MENNHFFMFSIFLDLDQNLDVICPMIGCKRLGVKALQKCYFYRFDQSSI